ncbi:GlxA family transcriptional regulator [Mumia sp. Pv 4-285]|uniref:GlxA family transcriptional regulator n=1 Tax=Mumia qirimensis TaxID=3234852 RepID=UPI00351D983B
MNATRTFVVVGYPGAELLDIASVTTTLALANHVAGRHLYASRVVTQGGAPVTSPSGLSVNAHDLLEREKGPVDTLVVSGGFGHDRAAEDIHLVAHVRRLSRDSTRVASLCTGAGVLAAAGLLDGRRVATHWQYARTLAHRYPAVVFDPRPIYVRDGKVATSAGVTASLDLSLALLEEDHGPALARDVARQLVTYMQRPGNQAQMSVFTSAPAPTASVAQQASNYVVTHLDDDLSASRIAEAVGLSERHLSRLFLREFDQTPARFVRQARAQAAAHLLTSTTLTLAAVATRCGFSGAESLRQVFVAIYGTAPSHYRRTQSQAISCQARA